MSGWPRYVLWGRLAGLLLVFALLGLAHLAVANVADQSGAALKANIVATLKLIVSGVACLIFIYMLRHLFFTLNRVFGRQRHPYLDIDTATWPSVTVLVPAHNEEQVLGEALEALLAVDYPHESLTIMPIDDRSSDGTRAIVNVYANSNPDLVRPFLRNDGMPGKAAAIKDAMSIVDSEIIVMFDADYLPGRGLIKQLVAPMFDPEIGAVMGRVVPHNSASNLLTRLLDMERAGGYQVDQQARMNLHLVPQFGGSVGSVRVSALNAVGGWRETALAEDTDLTYRLLLHGYKTAYENRSECYEEVPEHWQERHRQIMRWARGHNDVALRYLLPLLRSDKVRWYERLDALLLLGVYLMAPILVLGWMCALALFFLGEQILPPAIVVVASMVVFMALGNFATFFEVAAALYLDGRRRAIRLLPLSFLNFLVSLVNITRATLKSLVFANGSKGRLHWAKTRHYGGRK